MMEHVTVITHPLVQHNLTRLRDRRTGPQEFRRVLGEVAALMLYEATRSFAVEPVSVKTPLAPARGFHLSREVVLVPVLRAGLGMLDSILQLIESPGRLTHQNFYTECNFPAKLLRSMLESTVYVRWGRQKWEEQLQ